MFCCPGRTCPDVQPSCGQGYSIFPFCKTYKFCEESRMSLDHDFVMWKNLEAEANDAHPFLTRPPMNRELVRRFPN